MSTNRYNVQTLEMKLEVERENNKNLQQSCQLIIEQLKQAHEQSKLLNINLAKQVMDLRLAQNNTQDRHEQEIFKLKTDNKLEIEKKENQCKLSLFKHFSSIRSEHDDKYKQLHLATVNATIYGLKSSLQFALIGIFIAFYELGEIENSQFSFSNNEFNFNSAVTMSTFCFMIAFLYGLNVFYTINKLYDGPTSATEENTLATSSASQSKFH